MIVIGSQRTMQRSGGRSLSAISVYTVVFHVHVCCMSEKNCANLFMSELHQISFDNFLA